MLTTLSQPPAARPASKTPVKVAGGQYYPSGKKSASTSTGDPSATSPRSAPLTSEFPSTRKSTASNRGRSLSHASTDSGFTFSKRSSPASTGTSSNELARKSAKSPVPNSSLSADFTLSPQAIKASSAAINEAVDLRKGLKWYLGAASVAFGSKRVADTIMRIWADKGEIEKLLASQRQEVLKLHAAHRREVTALKSAYNSHISDLTRQHRADLVAASKTASSLAIDLKRALGAMAMTVDMVNRFQANPKAFFEASAKRFTSDTSDEISNTLTELEASISDLSPESSKGIGAVGTSHTRSGYLAQKHSKGNKSSSENETQSSAADSTSSDSHGDIADDLALMSEIKPVSFASSSSASSVSSLSSSASSESDQDDASDNEDDDGQASLPLVQVTRGKRRRKRRHKIRMAVGERSNPVSARRRRIINAFQFLTRDKEKIEPTLRILMQMLNNIITHASSPDAKKYRVIRTGGQIFEIHVRFVRGAMEFLTAVGFHEDGGELTLGESTSSAKDAVILDDLRFAHDLLSNL